jgi:hypothetical protein
MAGRARRRIVGASGHRGAVGVGSRRRARGWRGARRRCATGVGANGWSGARGGCRRAGSICKQKEAGRGAVWHSGQAGRAGGARRGSGAPSSARLADAARCVAGDGDGTGRALRRGRTWRGGRPPPGWPGTVDAGADTGAETGADAVTDPGPDTGTGKRTGQGGGRGVGLGAEAGAEAVTDWGKDRGRGLRVRGRCRATRGAGGTETGDAVRPGARRGSATAGGAAGGARLPGALRGAARPPGAARGVSVCLRCGHRAIRAATRCCNAALRPDFPRGAGLYRAPRLV